jgi:hypothetical protein
LQKSRQERLFVAPGKENLILQRIHSTKSCSYSSLRTSRSKLVVAWSKSRKEKLPFIVRRKVMSLSESIIMKQQWSITMRQ